MEIDITTPEGRAERARLAASTRWSKRFDWETSPIDDCKLKLADLRVEAERGGLILQRRMDAERVTTATCFNPECKTGPGSTRATFEIARAVGGRSRINESTGLMETAYACSAACYLYLSANFKHAAGAVREPVTQPVYVNNEAAIPKI